VSLLTATRAVPKRIVSIIGSLYGSQGVLTEDNLGHWTSSHGDEGRKAFDEESCVEFVCSCIRDKGN
jgi:hypothetical protein